MISKRLEPISIRPADSTLVGSGALVTILRTPAEEFRPKSVPCGPDRTSTRATSKSWGGVVDPEPSDTLSTTTPTLPSERSEEHTSELQSLMRNSYAVFCLKKTKHTPQQYTHII